MTREGDMLRITLDRLSRKLRSDVLSYGAYLVSLPSPLYANMGFP